MCRATSLPILDPTILTVILHEDVYMFMCAILAKLAAL